MAVTQKLNLWEKNMQVLSSLEVGLGHVHSADNFLRTRNIHSADLLNLLHHINKPSLLGKVGQRTGVLRHRCAGCQKKGKMRRFYAPDQTPLEK